MTQNGVLDGALDRVQLYLTVFLAGAAVLVIELVSARHMAPFYGTSLAVWTAVISITLAALSMGYVLGGWFGDRMMQRDQSMFGLALILTVAAVMCSLLPVIGPWIMVLFQGAGLVGGTLLSTAALLLPPLGALGMVGPYTIRIFTRDVSHAGRVAGRVFAVSTVGSIIAAMMTGYFFVPVFGIRATCLMVAIVLAVLAVFAFCRAKQVRPQWVAAHAALLVLCMIPLALKLQRPTPVTIDGIRLLEISEGGPYGEIKIIEVDTAEGPSRSLLFDGRYQSNLYVDIGVSGFPYVHVLAAGVSELPRGSRILVIGVGGGVLCNLLDDMGYRVIGVDLDHRMLDMAHKWFDLRPGVELVMQDGRQYIDALPAHAVDAIVFDAFTGDREPTHLMTVEALQRAKQAVRPGGLLAMNVLMHTQGPHDRAFTGLIRTMRAVGLHPHAYATGPEEDWPNTLIFARSDGDEAPPIWRRQPLAQLGETAGGVVLRDFLRALEHPIPAPSLTRAPLYRDDRASLDTLNQRWNHTTRRQTLEHLGTRLIFY